METISFSCPKCNFQMSAETIYCGQVVRCVQCNNEVQIPQKTEIPTTVSSQGVAQPAKQDNGKKLLLKLPVLLWILVVLQLGCFIFLFCISLNTKSSPSAYEYQVKTFDRYYRRNFEDKMREWGKEGWEYVGPLSNGEVLFRKKK